MIREKAKAHIQNWIRENQGPAPNMAPPNMAPPNMAPPNMAPPNMQPPGFRPPLGGGMQPRPAGMMNQGGFPNQGGPPGMRPPMNPPGGGDGGWNQNQQWGAP